MEGSAARRGRRAAAGKGDGDQGVRVDRAARFRRLMRASRRALLNIAFRLERGALAAAAISRLHNPTSLGHPETPRYSAPSMVAVSFSLCLSTARRVRSALAHPRGTAAVHARRGQRGQLAQPPASPRAGGQRTEACRGRLARSRPRQARSSHVIAWFGSRAQVIGCRSQRRIHSIGRTEREPHSPRAFATLSRGVSS